MTNKIIVYTSDYCSYCAQAKKLLQNKGFDFDELNITNPLVGDGYCNDETNNPNCNFDGGDCCGPCLNKEFCSECLCHLGNLC